MKDNDVLVIGALGLAALYFMYKNSPAQQAATTAANNATIQAINAQTGLNQTTADVNAATGLINTLANDFSY